MIHANEVRIYNYVSVDGSIPVMVSGIDYEHGIITVGQGINTKGANISGIPLTPELLEKTNFIEIDDDGLYELNTEVCSIQIQHNYLAEDGFSLFVNRKPVGLVIPYLHLLQNVVFALTQTELTINIKPALKSFALNR